MFEILKSILFGIVEGITEWLPVSSTGHMIILNEFIQFNVSPDFYSVYETLIQLGAITAVILVFWERIWPFARPETNPCPLMEQGAGEWIREDVFFLWLHILVSCLPAIIIGVPFSDFFEKHFYNYKVVALMLILFGIGFLAAEEYRKGQRPVIRRVSDISWKNAFIIGCWQLLAAIFPGVSRSGATIIGMLLLGVSRLVAGEYPFFPGIPAVLGASLLRIIKHGLGFTGFEFLLLFIGMAVAFLVSLIVIKSMLAYIRKHDFRLFGYYRIMLGLAVLICGLLGLIK